MRSLFVSFMCLSFSLMTLPQTQQGYVKTKGRLGNNGSVIAGTRLSGATVTVKGGNAVVSGSNGTFSLSLPNNNSFFLQNVQKQGYVLTDPDVLSKQYVYSKNPLVLVLEDKNQQQADRRAIERKISSNLYAQLQKRNDELEALKEQHKITEEKYRELLQKLNSDQDDNTRLISEMADRYSKMDFDDVDEFNRRISDCILNGRLTEVDSLINTKGDINSRTSQLRQHQEANAQAEQELRKKQKKLEKSKLLAQKELEDLAQDCYSKFEIFKLQHENDSALYYIELRADLDTTNVEWQNEAGKFIDEYLANYSSAMNYYQRCLNLAIVNGNDNNSIASTAYNNIGEIYQKKGDYEAALRYHFKSLRIDSLIGGECFLNNIANSYNCIGVIYERLGNYSDALAYLQKALDIRKDLHGLQHKDVATCINNIGTIYSEKAEYEKALDSYRTALEIRIKVCGEKSQDVATCYNNIGVVYFKMKDYSKALEFMLKDLDINIDILGENHPHVGQSYNNIGNVYMRLKKFSKAIEFFHKDLTICTHVYGNQHPSIATCLNNIGFVYSELENYDKAIEYCTQGMSMRESIYGKNHWTVANSYFNMGTIYYRQGKYSTALNYYENSLKILEKSLGNNHPNTKMVSEKIDNVKKLLNGK